MFFLADSYTIHGTTGILGMLKIDSPQIKKASEPKYRRFNDDFKSDPVLYDLCS